ncbi:MAG: hypothetical protein AMXMBFR33_01680 [Candidatus Xenobia bacterium]
MSTTAHRWPALIPIAYVLQGRTDFMVRKTKAGRWQIQGELVDHCCPVRAANIFLKEKGPCSCGPEPKEPQS